MITSKITTTTTPMITAKDTGHKEDPVRGDDPGEDEDKYDQRRFEERRRLLLSQAEKLLQAERIEDETRVPQGPSS